MRKTARRESEELGGSDAKQSISMHKTQRPAMHTPLAKMSNLAMMKQNLVLSRGSVVENSLRKAMIIPLKHTMNTGMEVK